MKRLLLSLCFLATLPAAAITSGQVIVQVYNGSGFTPYYITLGNGQALGWNAGVPAALTPFDGAFTSITGKPTTLAGYGITDALSATIAAATYQPLIADGTLPLAKLATDPLARANHTGTQLLATISDAGALAALNTVASAQITDGTIVDADISSSAAISDGKIASATTWNAKEAALTFSSPLSRSTNTISLAASGVTAGTYGSAAQASRVTVDAYGRITTASEVAITPAETAITFTDVTTGNASTAKHGFLRKLTGSTTDFLRADGTWATPPNGLTIGATSVFNGTNGYILINNSGVIGELALGSGVSDALVNAVDASGGLLTYDSDLAIYAGITPSDNVQTLLGAADYAAFKSSLSLGNVENTALSTWTGSSSITTVGALGSLVVGSTSGGIASQVINISLAHYTAGSPRPLEVLYWTGSYALRLDLDGSLSVGGNLTAAANVAAGNSFYFPNSSLLMYATSASDTGNAYTFTDHGGSNLRQIKARSVDMGSTVGGTLVFLRTGTGSPEGVLTAPVGSLYLDQSGSAGTTLYVKESGTGNTGWVGK